MLLKVSVSCLLPTPLRPTPKHTHCRPNVIGIGRVVTLVALPPLPLTQASSSALPFDHEVSP